jgi:hypothetical protein
MLTGEELLARRDQVRISADLQTGVAAMRTRLDRLLREPPIMPATKALLSVNGGVCPDDGGQLRFDPWSPTEHRCPACQSTWTGERHDRAWARWQHLWLAERAAELATLAALTQDQTAGQRAGDILSWYAEHYAEFPNRDNVLGPARLFFSTYLESIWVDNLLSAAVVLGDAGLLDDSVAALVANLADEAAGVIGEFDEQLSNRQIWNNAALLGIAVWFEDEGLAHRCIEGTSGVIAQLLHGFGSDGLWYEGENYHFFALQGLLHSAGWARLAGVDLFAEPELVDPLHRALLVARETALPDLTYPARKDSRFGVSLAQPMFLESWEIGLARAAAAPSGAPPELTTWLRRLYAQQTPQGQLFDSYLHEIDHPPKSRSRSDLSWRALLEMLPDLPDEDGAAEELGGQILESHGLAILRSPARYVSLECGTFGGGHGHPDRLHLTVHAAGVPWLLDHGTGSYVSEDLKYYRSSVGHNAPFLNGESQPPGDASCEAFDVDGEWGWIQGAYGDLRRTVVAGPDSVVDITEFVGEEAHLLEIPWHFHGRIEVVSPGKWVEDPLEHPRTSNARRFEPSGPGTIEARITGDDAVLSVQFHIPGELWRLEGPGLTDGSHAEFLLVRCSGRHSRCVTSLDWVGGHTLEAAGDLIETRRGDHLVRHRPVSGGWQIEDGKDEIRLGGSRASRADREPIVPQQSPLVVRGVAPWRAAEPDIDGSLSGFSDGAPLHLDHEDQYRRSEIPYEGPDNFSAVAYPAWGEEGLYLAVGVTKPDPYFRGPDAAPLLLDNEPDDTHCDGVQVYLTNPEHERVFACVAVPEPGSRNVAVRIAQGSGSVRGAWTVSASGYCLTLCLTPAWWEDVNSGDEIGFDVIVNESRGGQDRRAGQLVWSGGGGWVWLRGDRQDPSRFGTLELR